MYWKKKNKEARSRIGAALEDASSDVVKALAIFASDEKKFRETARKIGYGMKYD